MPFGSYQLSLQANVASSHYTLCEWMVSQTGLRGWRLLHTMRPSPPALCLNIGTRATYLGAQCSSQGLWLLVTLLMPKHGQQFLQPRGWCRCFFHRCSSIQSAPLAEPWPCKISPQHEPPSLAAALMSHAPLPSMMWGAWLWKKTLPS